MTDFSHTLSDMALKMADHSPQTFKHCRNPKLENIPNHPYPSQLTAFITLVLKILRLCSSWQCWHNAHALSNRASHEAQSNCIGSLSSGITEIIKGPKTFTLYSCTCYNFICWQKESRKSKLCVCEIQIQKNFIYNKCIKLKVSFGSQIPE